MRRSSVELYQIRYAVAAAADAIGVYLQLPPPPLSSPQPTPRRLLLPKLLCDDDDDDAYST